ncbi:MAG TPA: hypothetical protein DDZ80_12480 [Cyanobacteria bacterium UBA8803]|nr:hypothetical protein [Cyanobacteria bacterium UBA9273]HBL59294.1 hypothetical protein [Cyanobacteria bacterium UBA8803]
MDFDVAKNTCNCGYLALTGFDRSFGIKPGLQEQLWAAMNSSGMNPVTANLPGITQLTPQTVPLRRLSVHDGVVYQSAIALKLAPLLHLDALDIAHQLIVVLPTLAHNSTESFSLDFGVEVLPPGWINFRLSDRSLATWLQQLIRIPPLRTGGVGGEKAISLNATPDRNFFPLQYVHARCCSLLHLAHRQGLIQLHTIGDRAQRNIVEPDPIPWLDDSPKAGSEQLYLRLVHPAELSLITQMLDLLDATSKGDRDSWLKRGIALSQAFEQFYSSCRIWGEVKTQNPQLAQARLGLVALTQLLLRSLLEDQLGIPAPAEL